MKLNKQNITKSFLINLVIMLSILFNIFNCQLSQNQLSSFPNHYLPQTSKKNLQTANYTAPLMSRSLLERNPRRKLKKNDFLETFRYGLYEVTRGEAEQIFQFIDLNHDDLIDNKEWEMFISLYVLPFEACDKDQTYLIEPEEFKLCFDKDPKTSVIIFRRRYESKKYEILMDVLSTRGRSVINFADYMFLRRAFDTLVLEKSQFIKAIREDRIPMNWSEDEINHIYDLIDTTPFNTNKYMKFDTWSFFYNIHRIFFKYNLKKPLQLARNELLRALDDPYFPVEFLQAIDYSRTNFTEPQYMEVSMNLERLRNNERDFYFGFKQTEKQLKNKDDFRFKQDASVFTKSFWDNSTINSTYYDSYYNLTSRIIFFTSMTEGDKNYWTLKTYYNTMMQCNFYTTLRGPDEKIFLNSVNRFVQDSNKIYEVAVPPIGMKLRKNYNFYKNLPRDIQLDILCYLALENFDRKMKRADTESNLSIGESDLKIIWNDFGMKNMPDHILDVALKGKDTINRRLFSQKDTMRNIMIIQATVSDYNRGLEKITEFGLKINTDHSRLFPDDNRRFLSSPLA